MSTHILLVMPVLVPLSAAIASLFAGKQRLVINIIAIAAGVINLFIILNLFAQVTSFGPQAMAFGNWQAPFGIIFVADLFTLSMLIITAVISICMAFYFHADLGHNEFYGLRVSLMQFLLSGVFGVFLTGDIFNLYVWLEVTLISSFGLIVVGGGREQIFGAFKYVILNLVSTVTILLAVGLLYGATGTLNIADLHNKITLVPADTSLYIAGLLLLGFAVKAALFPVFAWLPASYSTMPSSILALFSALQTKVGVYIIIRVFSTIFFTELKSLQNLLIIVAGLTMLTGVLGATIHIKIKKILSFHIISQIGYMIMGLAVFTPIALAGAIFFVIHNMIVKTNLFLIGGVLARSYGSDNLNKLGSGYTTMPWLSLFFIISAFSLVGFPPFSGFWGKFMIIKESIHTGYYLLAATALLVGLLTLYSMSKIWSNAFWKTASAERKYVTSRDESWCYYAPIITLSLLTIVAGLAMEPLVGFFKEAAEQLLQPDPYIKAVLGQKP